MEHEKGWTIVSVLGGLYPWNILKTVPGRGRPGTTTQLGPLHGPGMFEGGSGKGAYGLPT